GSRPGPGARLATRCRRPPALRPPPGTAGPRHPAASVRCLWHCWRRPTLAATAAWLPPWPVRRHRRPLATLHWLLRRSTSAVDGQGRSRLDHDQPFLGHLTHGVRGTLPCVATVAQTAVRHLIRPPRGYFVHEHPTEVERPRGAQGDVEIVGEDRRLQPVARVIREFQGLVDGV